MVIHNGNFAFSKFFNTNLVIKIFFPQLSMLLVFTPIIGMVPAGDFRRWLNKKLFIISFRVIARSFSGIIRFHNKQWMPLCGSTCVANHTSPYDVVILSTDNCYSMVSCRWKIDCIGTHSQSSWSLSCVVLY